MYILASPLPMNARQKIGSIFSETRIYPSEIFGGVRESPPQPQPRN
jgi:hypothetical protein